MGRDARDPEPDFRVDLHGRTVAEALRALRHALHTCRYRGIERALVITGRGWHNPGGRSVLGPAVEEWLRGAEARALGVKSFRRRSKGGALEVTLELGGAPGREGA